MKPFKTITEQIKILERRGLKFKDIDKAKQYLLNNNYYDVINQYSKFFIDNNSNNYYDDVFFEDVVTVHNFEKNVKKALLSAFIEGEKQFKSIISYRFSEMNQNNLNCYLLDNTYTTNNSETKYLISSFKKTINKNRKLKGANSIKHYYSNNNKIIPFWVLAGHLTFGQIVLFYDNIDKKIQNKINKDLAYFIVKNHSKKLTTYLNSNVVSIIINNIKDVRNICAHNNKLLNHKCKYSIPYYFEIHNKYNINKISNRVDIFNIFVAMQLFLDFNQFANINNKLRKCLNSLRADLNNKYFEHIINSLGFPNELPKIQLKTSDYEDKQLLNLFLSKTNLNLSIINSITIN